jgi:opacity protein-like surface antigen
MARGVHFQIGIAGFLIFIATAKGTDTAVQDAMTPNPYALPSSIGSDPSKELTDAPIPGQKSADGVAPGITDSQELSPFYVRTGVGLSFVTNVDYPDFGITSDVTLAPGFATGVMLGTQFHDNIAFEIEGGLLYNSVYQNQLEGISATEMTQVTNIQLFQVPMMGNFVFRTDPLAGSMVRLVAGGGMGGIFRQVFITGGPNDNTRSQTLSAYQGFGGVQINPGAPDLMVDVQFRYLNSIGGQSVPAMSIMGTVTIRF